MGRLQLQECSSLPLARSGESPVVPRLSVGSYLLVNQLPRVHNVTPRSVSIISTLSLVAKLGSAGLFPAWVPAVCSLRYSESPDSSVISS